MQVLLKRDHHSSIGDLSAKAGLGQSKFGELASFQPRGFTSRNNMSKISSPSSSAAEGFFQKFPKLLPQYQSHANPSVSESSHCDPILHRVLALYLPTPIPRVIDVSLHTFSAKCLAPSTLQLTVNCETNPPYLRPLSTFGEANIDNPLVTSEGWRGLKSIQTEAGIVALGYSRSSNCQYTPWNRRIHQFVLCFLWTPSSALVTCPAAMTDASALLLSKHLDAEDGDQPGRAKVLREARRRLISFDPSEAWTSGQWMTERTGGSDVSQTETLARRMTPLELSMEASEFSSASDASGMPLGPWRIDGFKWFSSAIDADTAILLARTGIGISAFFAPLRRERQGGGSVLNGIKMTRLKEKLGTRGLPTAELEIRGMRAWLLGEEGRGTKEISTMLNATRIWTAISGVGGWARGLAISRAYSLVRKVKDDVLGNNKAFAAWMATEVVKYRACVHLAFLNVALLGISEQGSDATKATMMEKVLPSDPKEANILLRVLTPVAKAQCSLGAIHGLRECMESMGGVGYCENNDDGGIMNIARLYRDANVNAIWEGTTDVLAEDLVKAVGGKSGTASIEALDNLVRQFFDICSIQFPGLSSTMNNQWFKFKEIVHANSTENVVYFGRTLLQLLQAVVCTGLLMYDALNDGDEVTVAVAQRWGQLNQGIFPDEVKYSNRISLRDQDILMGHRSNPSGIQPKL